MIVYDTWSCQEFSQEAYGHTFVDVEHNHLVLVYLKHFETEYFKKIDFKHYFFSIERFAFFSLLF